MGRLIIEQLISVDGVTASPRGDLDFHRAAGDLSPMEPAQLAMLARCDAILLGANTYRLFAAHWPTADPAVQPVATPINALPKHVVSSTLAQAPWGDHVPARIERGDGVEVARRLTREYEGDVVVWGSLTLTDALLRADVVDELRLRIVPVLMGAGRTLAMRPLPAPRMRPTSATTYPTGLVALDYERDRRPARSIPDRDAPRL